MKTMQVEIKDPRAVKILSDLADLGIISIQSEQKEEGLLSRVNKMAENSIPSTDDIRKEVQLVMQSILYNNKILKSNGL